MTPCDTTNNPFMRMRAEIDQLKAALDAEIKAHAATKYELESERRYYQIMLNEVVKLGHERLCLRAQIETMGQQIAAKPAIREPFVDFAKRVRDAGGDAWKGKTVCIECRDVMIEHPTGKCPECRKSAQ
jgi:Arc/MetJ family transcription regulator